jgi:hypothetical protein
MDVLAALSIFVGLTIVLDLAALRWGVDSRFIDVRSDF